MLVLQYSNHLNVCLSHKQNIYSSLAPYPNNSCISNALSPKNCEANMPMSRTFLNVLVSVQFILDNGQTPVSPILPFNFLHQYKQDIFLEWNWHFHKDDQSIIEKWQLNVLLAQNILNEEFSDELRSCLSWEKQKVPFLWSITSVLKVNSTLGWSAVVFCACETVIFCYVLSG